ncbi:Alcohol dehydrogenase transcription factor Myb/SANT-like [Popillia japonica]|uniref:Alcohol dehydrogenase transcription factor Myb/SANT-like n=1 Tax=Popillia japonica TaxID=7064 RepID=A0AAW1JHQ6_POPJA
MVDHINYKNKSKRRAALNSIALELNKSLCLNVDSDRIVKKINGLRTTFMQELNKIKKSKITGSSSEEIYIPTWWCYDLLLFLVNGKTLEKGESNLSNRTKYEASLKALPNNVLSTEEEDEQEVMFDGTLTEFNNNNIDMESLGSPGRSSTPAPQFFQVAPPKKRKKENCSDEKTEFLRYSSAALKLIATKSQEIDHIAAFCQMLDKEMRLIKNEEKVRSLKKKIIFSV